MAIHGGSAADATIVTAFCFAVTSIDLSGLGGSMVATILARPTNESQMVSEAIVAQGIAPLLANRKMYFNHPNPDVTTTGGLAIAVPGQVAGLYTLWQKYGKLAWDELVMPSVYLLDMTIAHNKTFLNQQSQDRRHISDQIRTHLPALRRTLEEVAKDPMSFYNGQLAKDVVSDIRESGGILSEDDFANYRIKNGPAAKIQLEWINRTLYTTPWPSGGGFINDVMSGIDNDTHENGERELIASRILGQIETCLFIMESGLYNNATLITNSGIRDLFSGAFKSFHKKDDYPNKETKVRNNSLPPVDIETISLKSSTSIVVYGIDGSTIVSVFSLNDRLGSKVIGPLTGILFNNEMSTFHTVQNQMEYRTSWHNHHIQPRAMSKSFMSPLILTDSLERVSLAAAGTASFSSLTNLAEVIINRFYNGKPLGETLSTPRIDYHPIDGSMCHEPHYYKSLRKFNRNNFDCHMGSAIDVLEVRYSSRNMEKWWDKKALLICHDGRGSGDSYGY